MAKALFITVSGEGHINPTLPLVSDLVTRGEHIVYYSTNNFQKKIEKTGAEFRSIDQEAQRKMHESLSLSASQPKEYMLQFLSSMEMITGSIMDDISNEQYDYLLYDAQTLPGIWIAYQRRLISVATWTTFAYSLNAEVNMELTGSGYVKRKQQNAAMLEAFFRIEEIANNIKHLENKYEVPLNGNFLLCPGAGDLNIVFTSSLFQRNGSMFGDNFVFVGPSINTEREQDDSFPMHELEGNRVVLIAMGTVANKQLELYQKCLAAFVNLDAKVVMSIGRELTEKQLGNIPDNFIVRQYVPQVDILRHTDVFITHSGMNSISEALYFDVPVVMIPLMNDQHSIAERVKEIGAGPILDIHNLSIRGLQQAVNEVLKNPDYKENAKRVSQSFHEAGGYAKASSEVLKFSRSTATCL